MSEDKYKKKSEEEVSDTAVVEEHTSSATELMPSSSKKRKTSSSSNGKPISYKTFLANSREAKKLGGNYGAVGFETYLRIEGMRADHRTESEWLELFTSYMTEPRK